ncbi:MAG TPA: LytTR family transcriptional regulator, partial [Amaricoccus sp.]|nr:LytTR family transcriptional regulator [Amaricoccus sp.]
LVLLDGGWGDAPDWNRRMDRAAAALDEAARNGRQAAVVTMGAEPLAGEAVPWRTGAEWRERLAGLAPAAWAPHRAAWAGWVAAQEGAFETLWLGDGIGHGGEAELARALLGHGPVTLVGPPLAALALTPPRLEGGEFRVEVLRAGGGAARPVGVMAMGPDPNGIERVLGAATGEIGAGEAVLDLAMDLPVELRNRVARVQLAEGRSAAGVVLADDSVRRRKVGLMSGRAGGEEQDLNDPLHYLRKALEPFAEVIEAPLGEMLNAGPDVLVLADVGTLGEAERAALIPWVEKGGLLVRFAGPRLAQSGVGQLEEDPLLPVRLRAGGRSIGGAMSWGAPRRLRPFPESGPFAGLEVPRDVDISSQVMAQPDPDLPERVLASLEDGTPLVTGRSLGDGRVVLFHVTANADWSSLPLSGLFVEMLERLTQSAGGLAAAPETLAGAVWTPLQVLDGYGGLAPPSLVAGVPGERLAEARPSPETPPGIYAAGERRVALNVMRA